MGIHCNSLWRTNKEGKILKRESLETIVMVFLCLQLKNYKLLNVTVRFWNKEIAFSKYTTSPKFNFKNMCSAFKNISKNLVCISCIWMFPCRGSNPKWCGPVRRFMPVICLSCWKDIFFWNPPSLVVLQGQSWWYYFTWSKNKYHRLCEQKNTLDSGTLFQDISL